MWVHLVPFSCLRAGVNYTLCENLYKDKSIWEFHVHALKVGVKLSSIQFRSHSQEPSHGFQVNIVPFRWNLYMLQYAFIETSSLQFNSTKNTQESILVLMLQPKSFQETVTYLQTLNLVLVCLVWAQTLWIRSQFSEVREKELHQKPEERTCIWSRQVMKWGKHGRYTFGFMLRILFNSVVRGLAAVTVSSRVWRSRNMQFTASTSSSLNIRWAGVIASHFSAMAWNSNGTHRNFASFANRRPVSWILAEGLNPGCGRSIPATNITHPFRLKNQTD